MNQVIRYVALGLLLIGILGCSNEMDLPAPIGDAGIPPETRGDAPDSPTRRALLIGIDEYAAPHISDLRGCGNDVDLMRAVLIDKFAVPAENIKVLKDEEATREAIISAIQEHLIAKANDEDVVILHYSGHGSKIEDTSGDEIDDYDETLVPHDSRQNDIFDITDDEMNGLLGQLTSKTKKVTFILDSCHSGSALREGNATRIVEADTRPPPPPAPFAISTRGAGDGAADFRLNDSDYVLISGCRATELSNESSFNGNRHGAMTWFLAHALRAAEENTSYGDVMNEVSTEVTTRFPSQHPQIEGRGIDLRVLGTTRINRAPYVLVDSVSGERVQLGGGRVYGLANGALLDVYAPEIADFESNDPLAVIKIDDLQEFTASAIIQEGGPIPRYSKAALRSVRVTTAPIPVYVTASPSDFTQEILQTLQSVDVLELVEDVEEARLIVEIGDSSVRIAQGDLELSVPPISLSSPNVAKEVVETLQEVGHWMRVLDLRNPSSTIKFSFEIREGDAPEDTSVPAEVAPGAILEYRVKNTDSIPLYVYVLDVSSDGSIALLYPPVEGAEEQLAPGNTIRKRIQTFLPPEHSSVLDVFKVIVATQPINRNAFPQGSLTRSAESVRPEEFPDPMDQFWAAALTGKRGSVPLEQRSWSTKQEAVTIRMPGVRFSGFSVVLAQAPDDKLPTDFGNARSTCGPDSEPIGDCFQVSRTSSDGTSWELISRQSSRGDPQELRSVGELFDEAYQIQDQIEHAERIEPLFEVNLPGYLDERGIEKRAILSDGEHDPLAAENDTWHLSQLRAADAWSLVRAKKAVEEGQEASGIFVAHIDTGYREHPENWELVNGKRPIEPAFGYDYYDSDEDPIDPLLDTRLLDNPGHGTASGSVIVSPYDCQLSNQPGCAYGIARGAQLIPLRVHQTVSQFNTANLSRAIRDIAEGDVGGSPKLISIAMGGPPTLSMWKAVRKAEKNGILIVAAAGNYVRTVVWPARFKSTIAAAATNVRCEPWMHSSRGRKVDISAPGESVWRASHNEAHDYINGMGKGTTYATGNTAGAAALWLAYHSGEGLEELQSQGEVTKIFRQALRESAWKPTGVASSDPPGTNCGSEGWDDRRFGAGIIDIAGLLEFTWATQDSRSVGDSGELPDLPLYSSLYPDGTDESKIRADYERLFASPRGELPRPTRSYETELLYHYTVSEEVQVSVDAYIEGQRGMEPVERIWDTLAPKDLSTELRSAINR